MDSWLDVFSEAWGIQTGGGQGHIIFIFSSIDENFLPTFTAGSSCFSMHPAPYRGTRISATHSGGITSLRMETETSKQMEKQKPGRRAPEERDFRRKLNFLHIQSIFNKEGEGARYGPSRFFTSRVCEILGRRGVKLSAGT